MSDATDARVDEYDKDEWRDVARQMCPDWTDEIFEQKWTEFCRLKAEHARKKGLQ